MELEVLRLVVLSLGFIGNTLSMITLTRKTLFKLCVSRVLLALAISDTCCVVGLISRSELIPYFDNDILSRIRCFFLRYWYLISHWTMVHIGVERFIAVLLYEGKDDQHSA